MTVLVYPERAAVNQPVAKAKIYAHGGATARVKQLFVTQVEEIVWKYKLSPETVNLPAGLGVTEIQVFAIRQKQAELDVEVLRSVDRAVKFPVFFELEHEGRVREMACYKRPHVAAPGRWVLSEYFGGDWFKDKDRRLSLPPALDLAGLYAQLLSRLMPIAARPDEPLADRIARVEQLQAKRREVEKATLRLAKEKQFNRKVEINAALRQLKQELKQLTR